MKFTYDNEAGKFISDDPCVWVDKLGPDREKDWEFVLHFDGKCVGFLMRIEEIEKEELRAGETDVWVVSTVGNYVTRGRLSSPQVLADRYKFDDVDEQKKVVAYIKGALAVWSTQDEPVVRVELTSELQSQLEEGVLLR